MAGRHTRDIRVRMSDRVHTSRDMSVRRLCRGARLALALCLAGCGSFDFEVTRPIDEVLIEGVAQMADDALLPTDLLPTQQWDSALPGVPAGIFLERFTLEITDTLDDSESPDSFGFVDSIVFYVDPSDPTSRLPRHFLAWSAGRSKGATLDLVVNRAVNLLPYIQAGIVVLSEIDGRRPPDDVSFRGVATLGVDLL